jgi:hypothetical protein
MGRRLRGGINMQTRNGNLIITDLVASTSHERHLGTTTGHAGPEQEAAGGAEPGTPEDGRDRRSCHLQVDQPDCLR